MRRPFNIAAVAAAISTLIACSSAPSAPVPFAEGAEFQSFLGGGKIKHVVYVVQENRSFDDIFQGYPHADTVLRGKDSYGKTVKLRPISLKTAYEIDHSAQGMFAACDGTGTLPGTQCRMDGFNREGQYGGPRHGQYAYVPHHESKPYFDMAHEWVLADEMFASQLDESFVAHQYIIAAQAGASVDVPDFYWGCPGGQNDSVATITHRRTYGQAQRPCFDYETLGDELSKAGYDWRFYTSRYTVPFSGLWSGYQAVKHVFYSRVWKTNVITPQKKFLTDVRAGKLANFTWVTPLCADSDHPECGSGLGPSWVSSVVNAVGESKFWKTTVVFVQWDDWGGLYDHVPPPYKGYDGLGFRVPLIVISPMRRRTTSRTCSTRRRAFCALPKTCLASPNSRPPTLERPRRGPIASIFLKRHANSCRLRHPRMRRTS